MKKSRKKTKENSEKRHFLINPSWHEPTFEDLMRSVGLSPTGATRSYESLRKEWEEKYGPATEKTEKKSFLAKPGKMEISISSEEGIYRMSGERRLNYPIRGRKRTRLLYSFKDGRKDGGFLAGMLYSGDFAQLNKEIKGINTNFKRKLDLQKDLIIHIQTGGYKLNMDDYNIKFAD